MHYEKGTLLNIGIELDEDPFDGERKAYVRGKFIEEGGGEARMEQCFAFDVSRVDFVELLETLGITVLGVGEPIDIEVLRVEPPAGAATPILGFRSPKTGKAWVPRSPDSMRYEERITALERRNATQADTISRFRMEVAEAERKLTETLDLLREAHHHLDRADVPRVVVDGESIQPRDLIDRIQHLLALECPKCDGYRKLWQGALRERDELLGCTKEMVTSADGIGQQRDVAAEKERAQCWYLVRRRMAEAMLQLRSDAVEAGPPDPVAVLNDVAVAIAARGLEPAVIGQLDEKARARAHDRAACASRRIPDRFLTGQRYRIDVSVDNGDPVECVAGALWSSIDLAKTLGLGPEDIKRPLLQALAIFGHNVDVSTKAGLR